VKEGSNIVLIRFLNGIGFESFKINIGGELFPTIYVTIGKIFLCNLKRISLKSKQGSESIFESNE
jgi:hypothetical protein